MRQCENCINYNLYKMTVVDGDVTGTCKAFPNGIPSEIYNDKIKHNKPIKGDNGILYEKYVGVERY